jgi:hypothetical protein
MLRRACAIETVRIRAVRQLAPRSHLETGAWLPARGPRSSADTMAGERGEYVLSIRPGSGRLPWS